MNLIDELERVANGGQATTEYRMHLLMLAVLELLKREQNKPSTDNP